MSEEGRIDNDRINYVIDSRASLVEYLPLNAATMDKPAPGWAPPLDEQDATGAVEWRKFASRHKASDLRLQFDRETCRVQLRLDGVLVSVGELPGEAAARILGQVKYLAKLKTYVGRSRKDGRIAGADVGLASDVRVSCRRSPAKSWCCGCFTGGSAAFGQLGFRLVHDAGATVGHPVGMILLTGRLAATRPPPFTHCCSAPGGIGQGQQPRSRQRCLEAQ